MVPYKNWLDFSYAMNIYTHINTYFIYIWVFTYICVDTQASICRNVNITHAIIDRKKQQHYLTVTLSGKYEERLRAPSEHRLAVSKGIR